MTTETFVEDKYDDKEGKIDPDFFKMRIKDFKDDERKDKAEFSDENEDDLNDGCKSSTDEESNDEVNIHYALNNADHDEYIFFSSANSSKNA